MPLYELKLVHIHFVADTSEVNADLAAILFVASQQRCENC